MIVGNVRVNRTCNSGGISWRVNSVLSIPNSLLCLEIGLSIKIYGLDIGNSRGVRTFDQNEVCWESLIFIYLDKLPNLEVCPLVVDEAVGLGVDSLDRLVVLSLVFRSSFEVLKKIFDHRDEYHRHKSS